MLPSSFGPAKKAALAKIPYVNLIPEDGRIISLLSFFDEKEKIFKLPIPKDNDIILMKATPEQGPYYARVPVDEEKDVYLKLIDYVNNVFSFPSTIHTLLGIERDILNCSAVVEKYFIFLDLFRRNRDPLIANLVMTDVEFLFGNIRSLYDSLQILLRDILERVGNVTSKKLPQSYYDVVKLENSKIQRKYNLPNPLLQFYADTRDFFLASRKIRGGFQHQRIDIPVIFSLDEGFALQKNGPFFKDPIACIFDIWPENKIKENGLVSLLALIAHLNKTVLTHTDLLFEALSVSVSNPSPIIKEHKVFLRGPYTIHLQRLSRYLNDQWVTSPISQ